MAIPMKQRRGTAAAITTAAPTPAAGELVFETDTLRFKLGNGSTAWASLAYVLPYLSATDKILGRSSAGAGPAQEITCTAAGRALIDDADAAAQLTTLGAAPTASPTFTGVVTTAAGSASAPAIVSGTGTSDTGIFWGAADSFSITVAGSALLTLTSNSVSAQHSQATTPTTISALNLSRPMVTVLHRNANLFNSYFHGYTSGQTSGVFISGETSQVAAISVGCTLAGAGTFQSTQTSGAAMLFTGGHVTFVNGSGWTVSTNVTPTERMRVSSAGNLLIAGTANPTAGVGCLCIFNGTAPTASVVDGVVLYSQDVSASAELRVRDEAGNITTLSPHSFPLIPGGPSEPMAWAYYSERDGRRINVDMLKLARLVEKLSGEKLVWENVP